jgi:competence protein ComEC
MHPPYQIPFWKTAPLVRLLVPLILGILLQWYLQFNFYFILLCLGCYTTAFFLLYFFSNASSYYLRKIQGVLFHLFIAAIGLLITWQNDSRHQGSWYGHFYQDSSLLLVKINEPLVEKTKSYKVEGLVTRVINGNIKTRCFGKVLLYFSKDSASSPLHYGQMILISRPLQAIRNSGNPGAFDYRRYAAFQQIHHQVFLKEKDWVFIGEQETSWFRGFLYKARSFVLNALQKNIGNQHQELGIAEALLIGYKEDLDKDLVQAYSNTGVVHIIAISGLHLGLIFFVLTWIFNRVPYLKKSRHVKVILLLACLWLFSMLTGGSASVLRSAVMFTVIVIGTYYFRQSSIYSSLSASAFLLLCYNPYYLWDVGFQLSYLAVIGIVALQQPIYRLVYFRNPAVRYVWNMVSITVAAQVSTFPVCLYYFHQFPNLFLFTNLLTVPLSTVILFSEIFLVLVSGIDFLAHFAGIIITQLVGFMNAVILFFDRFSFSVTDQVYADLFTTWLLYGLVFFCCSWLIARKKYLLHITLFCLLGFSVLHAAAKLKTITQQKIIIYNVARHRAVDFIEGEKFVFVGDSLLRKESLLRNFQMKPARQALMARQEVSNIPHLRNQNFCWQFYQKKLLFLDSTIIIEPADSTIFIDILLISHNSPVRIKEIITAVRPAVIVFDASNSFWRIENWKKECEELNLRFHSVPEQGAFISNIRDS